MLCVAQRNVTCSTFSDWMLIGACDPMSCPTHAFRQLPIDHNLHYGQPGHCCTDVASTDVANTVHERPKQRAHSAHLRRQQPWLRLD